MSHSVNASADAGLSSSGNLAPPEGVLLARLAEAKDSRVA
jgi:hypothetical protein